MPFFSTNTRTSSTRRHSLFHRKDKNRVVGGLKSALSNPNTTSRGRKHAKTDLHLRGKSTHVPFMTKVKRTLGIRSSRKRRGTLGVHV